MSSRPLIYDDTTTLAELGPRKTFYCSTTSPGQFIGTCVDIVNDGTINYITLLSALLRQTHKIQQIDFNFKRYLKYFPSTQHKIKILIKFGQLDIYISFI